jgi:hypothetical protein
MQTRIDCFGKKQNELHFNDNDNNNTRFWSASSITLELS